MLFLYILEKSTSQGASNRYSRIPIIHTQLRLALAYISEILLEIWVPSEENTTQAKKSRPLSSAGALRSQDSPQMTSWQVRCVAGTPRKHKKKYLSRPFSGQRCGSYQKPDCSDWIQNFSRRLRPFRDHIALGRSALGEKEIEGLGLKFDPKPAEMYARVKAQSKSKFYLLSYSESLKEHILVSSLL